MPRRPAIRRRSHDACVTSLWSCTRSSHLSRLQVLHRRPRRYPRSRSVPWTGSTCHRANTSWNGLSRAAGNAPRRRSQASRLMMGSRWSLILIPPSTSSWTWSGPRKTTSTSRASMYLRHNLRSRFASAFRSSTRLPSFKTGRARVPWWFTHPCLTDTRPSRS